MKDERLPKRSESKEQGGCGNVTPQIRWEDCVKRNLRKAEEDEKWREQQQGAMDKNNKNSRTAE